LKTIKKLDKQLINKIAAGEVVERPLSIIKELTENSIDAGAGDITIEIKDGGLSYIRVTDNGGGILPEQIPLAFEQHATSKISDIDDLHNIKTLGFRGEALASIAAVSHVEMVTKVNGAVSGTKVALHGGTLAARQEIGCAEGTTITVSNLFFNTPARLKFLKKPPQEAAYITDLVQRLALGYPNKSFRYIQNGKIIATTNGNGDLKTVVYNLYDKETAKGLIKIPNNEFVNGFIGKPEIARGSRSGENFFINGRYVKNETIQAAVEDAYKTRLPIGKFPVCVLYVTVPEDEIDVNVHPTKMEIRFADERTVYSRVVDALNKTLADNILIPTITQKHPTHNYTPPLKPQQEIIPGIINDKVSINPPIIATQNNFAQKNMEIPPKAKPMLSLAEFSKKPPFSTSSTVSTSSPASTSSNFSPDLPISSTDNQLNELNEFSLLGQIFGTYWLATKSDDLFLIDQHAAHERILYEEILHKLKNETHKSQPLLEPIQLHLSAEEIATAQEYKQFFNDFGFQFSVDETLNITAVPLVLSECLDFTFFAELLEKLKIGTETTPIRKIREDVATAACKKAIKANDKISIPEVQKLISRVFQLDNPYSCPHGRPTIVKLSKSEIEKMFKRT